jgi:hypothetical protein
LFSPLVGSFGNRARAQDQAGFFILFDELLDDWQDSPQEILALPNGEVIRAAQTAFMNCAEPG